MFRIAQYHKTVSTPLRHVEEPELMHALAAYHEYRSAIGEGESCVLSMWHGAYDDHGFRVWEEIDRKVYA